MVSPMVNLSEIPTLGTLGDLSSYPGTIDDAPWVTSPFRGPTTEEPLDAEHLLIRHAGKC